VSERKFWLQTGVTDPVKGVCYYHVVLAVDYEAIRTELAKVTKERDEARACVKTMCNAGGFSEPHQGPDEYTNEIEDRAEALRGNIRYWKAATDERDAALAKLEEAKSASDEIYNELTAQLADYRAQLAAARAALQKANYCFTCIADTRFGYDGDCGVTAIANEGSDIISTALAS